MAGDARDGRGRGRAIRRILPKGIRHNIGYMAYHGNAWHRVHGLPSGQSFCPKSHDSAGRTTNPAPGFSGPLFRMWPWPNILGEGIVSVGVAASALEAAIELCKNKTPAYQGVPLRQQQLPQFLLGKAASRVEAARDTLFRAADVAYADVESSGKSLS